MSSRNPRLELGQRVEYISSGKRIYGKLAYGPNGFHVKPNENDWCGVVLDEPLGKNNGTVQGKQYFSCPDNYGIFVRSHLLKPVFESKIPSNRSQTSTPGFHMFFWIIHKKISVIEVLIE
jgi:dynactin 1